MKKLFAPFTLLFLGITLLSAQDATIQKIKPLKIGEQAPLTEVVMKEVKGHDTSLKNELRENGLMVIFSCNTCPYVIAWEDQYNPLNELGEKMNLGMVLINSNEAKRNGDDALEEMKKEHEAMKVEHEKMDKEHESLKAEHTRIAEEDKKMMKEDSEK